MVITATVKNSGQQNEVSVATNGTAKQLSIPARADSRGSSVNGGELLFLALATCFCNDVYREAAKRKLEVKVVEVGVTGTFGGEGEPAGNIEYDVSIDAHADENGVRELIAYVDQVAEVHNTLRVATSVRLRQIKEHAP